MVRATAGYERYKQAPTGRSSQRIQLRLTVNIAAAVAPSRTVPGGEVLAMLKPQLEIELCTTDHA